MKKSIWPIGRFRDHGNRPSKRRVFSVNYKALAYWAYCFPYYCMCAYAYARICTRVCTHACAHIEIWMKNRPKRPKSCKLLESLCFSSAYWFDQKILNRPIGQTTETIRFIFKSIKFMYKKELKMSDLLHLVQYVELKNKKIAELESELSESREEKNAPKPSQVRARLGRLPIVEKELEENLMRLKRLIDLNTEVHSNLIRILEIPRSAPALMPVDVKLVLNRLIGEIGEVLNDK